MDNLGEPRRLVCTLINWITLVLYFCYLFCSTNLRFQRSYALSSGDFGRYYTNTFSSPQWWFGVLVPNFLLPLVVFSLFLRLELSYTLNMFGIRYRATNAKVTMIRRYNNNNNPDVGRFDVSAFSATPPNKLVFPYPGPSSFASQPSSPFRTPDNNDHEASFPIKEDIVRKTALYKYLHVALSVATLCFLLVGLVFLSLSANTCNDPRYGDTNVCSNGLECCAADARSQLTVVENNGSSYVPDYGVTPGCPYIFSCGGITPPYSSAILNWDTYFALTFGFQIACIAIVVGHVAIGFTFGGDGEPYSLHHSKTSSS